MQVTDKHNQRIRKMTFASVYPHYVKKVEAKSRTITLTNPTTPMTCKNGSYEVTQKYCPNCGQPAKLKRIDAHY